MNKMADFLASARQRLAGKTGENYEMVNLIEKLV
jgi:hypothetical protein